MSTLLYQDKQKQLKISEKAVPKEVRQTALSRTHVLQGTLCRVFLKDCTWGWVLFMLPRASGTAGSSLHLSTSNVTRIQIQQRQESKESTAQTGGKWQGSAEPLLQPPAKQTNSLILSSVMVSQPCALERPYALGTSIKQNSLEFTEFASWVLQRILRSQSKLRYRKLTTCWQEGEHPPLAHVDYISSSASHRKPLHNESLRKEGLLIFMKVSFLHTSFPRQSCHTALVAAPAQAPARWWDLRRAVQDTTIWNSFLAWAMSTGTGNPPGSFLTCMLEFPGLQEGLAAQPAANTNLQIYWSLLNWLQVSAQLPQKGVLQLQGWNFMRRKLFCGGTGEKKAPAWSFWGTFEVSELNQISWELLINFSKQKLLIGIHH